MNRWSLFLIFWLLPLSSWGGQHLKMDISEVSIAEFSQFADKVGLITKAEKEGGMVYESGWVIKKGWNWATPYGIPSPPDEPAVHITFDEASAFCEWKGKRLPTRREWIDAAYTENRKNPSDGFQKGKTYRFPTGDSPQGANCLNECEIEAFPPPGKNNYSSVLDRGSGQARIGTTRKGVNGLFDMGANVWEWAVIGEGSHQATMGGSWWYGVRQMEADYGATKPRDMGVVYIGFRCIQKKEPPSSK